MALFFFSCGHVLEDKDNYKFLSLSMHILQGSVATDMRRGGGFNCHCRQANLLAGSLARVVPGPV